MPQQRHPWDPVVLTTLPHILCAIVAPYPYSAIIAASSVAHVAWHAEHEPRTSLFWIDYSLALIWGFYDVAQLGSAGLIINLIAIATNITANRLTIAGIFPYERGHSLWHLLSCILTVYKIDLLTRQKGETWPPRLIDSTTPPAL